MISRIDRRGKKMKNENGGHFKHIGHIYFIFNVHMLGAYVCMIYVFMIKPVTRRTVYRQQ